MGIPRLKEPPPVITLTLPEPPSSNRWWRKWRNRMVLSKEARDYKLSLFGYLTSPPMKGPVRVEMTWYRGRKSGDLDKRQGVLLDALQGVVYKNDSQVEELHAYRKDRPRNPGIVVTVTAL